MKLEDVTMTESLLHYLGYTTIDSVITDVDVDIIGHFNNYTCLRITSQDRSVLSLYQNTGNLGYLIRALVELFDLTKENGIKLSEIKNIRCRLVLQDDRCVGFGHPTEDKFVLSEVFARIDEM